MKIFSYHRSLFIFFSHASGSHFQVFCTAFHIICRALGGAEWKCIFCKPEYMMFLGDITSDIMSIHLHLPSFQQKNGIWSTWYGISHIGLGVVDMFIGHIILSFPLKQQSVETWYFQLLINEELIRWKSSIAGRDRRDWTCHYPRFPLAVPNHTHIQLTDSKRPKPPLLLEKLCLVS